MHKKLKKTIGILIFFHAYEQLFIIKLNKGYF